MENVDNYPVPFYLLETTTVKVVNRSVDKTVDNSILCGELLEITQKPMNCSYVLATSYGLIHKLSTDKVLKNLLVSRLYGVG